MPTALNGRIVRQELSNYDLPGDVNSGFDLYPFEQYSIGLQKELFYHICERNRITCEVAVERGTPLLDLFTTFGTEQLADFRQDFFDVMHLRPGAYGKMARAVCEGMGFIPQTDLAAAAAPIR